MGQSGREMQKRVASAFQRRAYRGAEISARDDAPGLGGSRCRCGKSRAWRSRGLNAFLAVSRAGAHARPARAGDFGKRELLEFRATAPVNRGKAAPNCFSFRGSQSFLAARPSVPCLALPCLAPPSRAAPGHAEPCPARPCRNCLALPCPANQAKSCRQIAFRLGARRVS